VAARADESGVSEEAGEMTTTFREALANIRSLLPAAASAWLVTVITGLGGAVAIAAARDPSAIAELVVIYAPVMSVPYALAIGGVLLPAVACVRVMAGPGRPWLLGLVGVAVAPLQGLVLLVGGRFLFEGSPRMRPTLAADLAAIVDHPAETVALLVAFGAGGLTLGMWAARRCQSLRIRTIT
jgi:hypothetical protein